MSPRITQVHALTTSPTLLILDRDDRIIGIRPSSPATKLACRIGDRFFARFAVDARDRSALFGCRQSFSGNTLLLHAKERPILMINHLYAVAGVTVVALPEGEVRPLLAYPADYFEILPQLTPAPCAMLRHAPVSESGYALLSEFLNKLCRPFSLKDTHTYTSNLGGALDQLRFHLTTLAAMFDCTVGCDLQGLAYSRFENYRPELALAAMTVILTAAKRLTGGCPLIVHGLWQEPAGPALTVTLPTVSDDLHEITAYMQQTLERGRYFEIRSDGSHTQITFALCVSELSAQGVKNNDLPEEHVEIPISSIDFDKQHDTAQEPGILLFHNGKWEPGAANQAQHIAKQADAQGNAIPLQDIFKN